MNLKDFAQQQNLSYSAAWRLFSAGKIPNAKKENGTIVITPQVQITTASVQNQDENLNIPILVGDTEKPSRFTTASSRRNRATTITPTDRYVNIRSGILPYKYVSGGVGNESMVSARDSILLCNLAYFSFSDVRSLLDYSASVATGKIYFKGGNKKARDFFTAWAKKVGIYSLQEQWYRERLRSGNCFIYRQDGKIQSDYVKLMNSTYGISQAAEEIKIPVKYILLNPADIALQNSAVFSTSVYHKLLNDYEIACLRNPKTQQDREIFNNLPIETQKLIKNKSASSLYIPLETNLIYYYGYKKSDYEHFGISLLYSILDDLEFYAELRRGDAAINRTLQQAVLLITMGSEIKDGNGTKVNINQNAMNAMAKLFENESTARVVVSTYDTKMEFLVPDIADILDPVKYQVVRERIKEGLNNILTGSGEKFSNRSVSVQLFIQQIKTAQNEFLEYFLQPEVKRISEILGFKNFPEAVYEDINLKDEVEFGRMVTRLNEIGTLTPAETLEAIQTGKLPTAEDSLENQQQLRKWKDDGFYQPTSGGGYDQLRLAKLKAVAPAGAKPPGGSAGRPKGTPQPKFNRKVKPVGGSTNNVTEQLYDLNKIQNNLILASKLADHIEFETKKQFKLKDLNVEQKQLVDELVEKIMINEASENWITASQKYLENPDINNEENYNKMDEISSYHNVNQYLAAILLNSQT